MIYKVVLAAEEEQQVFTQWLTAGREHNELNNPIKNFWSQWCNDDMEYVADGKIVPGEIVFSKDQGEGGEE